MLTLTKQPNGNYHFTHIKVTGKETKKDMIKILEDNGVNLFRPEVNKKQELILELIKLNESLISKEKGWKSVYEYAETKVKDMRELVDNLIDPVYDSMWNNVPNNWGWQFSSVIMELSKKIDVYLANQRTYKEKLTWQDVDKQIKLMNEQYQKVINIFVKDDKEKTIQNIKQLINTIPKN